jgi:hypothetical protein
MNNFIKILLLIVFTFFIITCGNSSQNQNRETIILKITRDNGAILISEKEVPYNKGMTVMDAVVKNFEVETAYGGGFISSINGMKSTTDAGVGRGYDWFYYVNGEEPKKGASDYILKPDDVLRWDYHKWTMDSITERFNSEQ